MSSLLQKEISHFKQLANAWQNPQGPLYTLHRLNPTRLTYIRKFVNINKAYEKKLSQNKFENTNLGAASQISTEQDGGKSGYYPYIVDRCLDIGCGAGIATKELANWCAYVKGVEPTKELVENAPKIPNVEYYNGLIEDLVESDKESYDLVSALEVVEHVADIDLFVSSISKVLKPNGTLIMSTLNRTPQSWLLGIFAAEYLTGIVPIGTHDWNQFVKPEELISVLSRHGIEVLDVVGVTYNPFTQEFKLSYDHLGVNYMLAARKVSRSTHAETQERVSEENSTTHTERPIETQAENTMKKDML